MAKARLQRHLGTGTPLSQLGKATPEFPNLYRVRVRARIRVKIRVNWGLG